MGPTKANAKTTMALVISVTFNMCKLNISI